MSDRRAYLTAKKRESRDRARAARRCIICTTNPADEDLVTCSACRRGVTETRRTYTAWSNVIYSGAHAVAGDDLDLQHHQPADRMVEFIVRSRRDMIRRATRLHWYEWRNTQPLHVVDDIVAAYDELCNDMPEPLATV